MPSGLYWKPGENAVQEGVPGSGIGRVGTPNFGTRHEPPCGLALIFLDVHPVERRLDELAHNDTGPN